MAGRMEWDKAMLQEWRRDEGSIGSREQAGRKMLVLVFFLVVTHGGSTMLPRGEGSEPCASLCPLAAAVSDPEWGRRG